MVGGTPFWVDYWEDFKEILGDVQDLFRLIFEKENTQSTVNLEDELSTALTDGIKITVSLRALTSISHLEWTYLTQMCQCFKVIKKISYFQMFQKKCMDLWNFVWNWCEHIAYLQKEETNVFIEIIKNSFGELTNQLKESLSDLVSPFFKAFYSVFNAIKAVKSGYTSIRDT